MNFLEDLQCRPLGQTVTGLRPEGLYIGPGDLGLEVAVYQAATRPAARVLQDAWKARRGTRAAPVFVVALYEGRAWVCGPTGDTLPILADKEPAAIERLCRTALKQPNRHAALLFLSQALPSLETPAPGLRNEGLFALHELTHDLPTRPEWHEHKARARAALGLEGRELLQKLGYTIDRLDNLTLLLRGADKRLALAVLLDQSEVPEAGTSRFNSLSPVSYALSKADSENLDWVLVIQGDRLRLYPTKVGIGVGRRGRTETYVELQTSLLSDEQAAYLTLLFSAEALKPGGTVHRLLEDSKRFAVDLAKGLRERIYESVVPKLARGVVAARNLKSPTADDLNLTYRMALTVLFRLLFVAYAEDRDLLPYRQHEPYRRRSLKQKAQELADHARALTPVSSGNGHWDEVVRIWTAIDQGDAELAIPAYNGGLFTRDTVVSPAGAALTTVKLSNEVFEPAFRDLLLVDMEPVDFRSLSVREFGTIYEGLLESELSVAEQDLALDNKGSYVPLKGKAVRAVAKGEIYLHDRSGARKSSGSYFTKSFAVEHLLDRALIPALDDHLVRISGMDEAAAAETFFDFRVADIAMGSGHFLVAAVDRIEKAFTDYLAKPDAKGAAGVRAELQRLKEAAKASLGDMAEQMVFEDGQLLRRLIARRCIYGVDLNPLSVELARLSIWIHTFVPGLPLSVLDHNLVNGDALVGVGTIQEIKEKFEAAGMSLFPVDADNLLGQAERPLKRLANLSDATMTDVAQARAAMEEARVAVGDTKALCDIITAQGLDPEVRYQFENWAHDRATIQAHPMRHRALKALERLKAFHFPIAFPEVFLRRRPGFNVILGNPPWEKARVEEHEFWARHFPGLRSLAAVEKERRIEQLRRTRPDLLKKWETERDETELLRDAVRHIPGMATGHPDLFRAFLWRFTQLVARATGHLAVVLPGDAFKIKGGADLRQAIVCTFDQIDVALLTNRGGWVFDGVHPQKLIALFTGVAGHGSHLKLVLTPECHQPASWEGIKDIHIELSQEWLQQFSSSLVLPILISARDINVLDTMMKAPRLSRHPSFSVRRVYADFETTRDRSHYHEDGGASDWPVYKGESFDLWEPDRGGDHYFMWTDARILDRAQERRLRAPRNSPYAGCTRPWLEDKNTHSILFPRIAFRDVSNRTNQRTLVTALIPPKVVTTQTAPWILWLNPDHHPKDEAFLIGVLSSRVCDWWTRRFVEGHVDEEAFNCLRVPEKTPDYEVHYERVVALSGRLAAPDKRFADWAKKVGVKHGVVPADEKQDMIDELDAVVARLYGLSKAQLVHIYETFHEGWDHEARLKAVLKHFAKWDGR